MKELSGEDLYTAFVAGGNEIISQTNFLNKINMFPVADKDTGNNLAYTLSAVIHNVKPTKSVTLTMKSIAEQALLGARGNSGIIFAQFFQGLAEKTSGEQNLRIPNFCDAVTYGAKRAYEAIYSPVEGTLLTAMRVWSESLEKFKQSKSYASLFNSSQPFLDEAVKNTVNYAHNKKNLDAGAQGFLYFVRGFAQGLYKGNKTQSLAQIKPLLLKTEANKHTFTEAPVYFYCTEFFLENLTLDINQLSDKLHRFGDSLVVAGTDKKARIHIHTNEPAEVAEFLQTHAQLRDQKVDNMLRQYEAAYKRKHNIGIVVDSGCDLSTAFIEENQIHILPLFINTSATSYLDKLTLDLPRLHQLAEQSSEFPTSSQPAPGQIKELYKNLLHYYDALISIHISTDISGTYETAKKVAKEFDARVLVFDSKTLSGGVAFYVKQVLNMIKTGATFSDITKNLAVKDHKQDFYLSVKSLDYIRRSGRVKGFKKILLALVNLRPLMVVKNGKISVVALAFSEKTAIKKLLKKVKRKLKKRKLLAYSLYYSSPSDKLASLRDSMRKLTGVDAQVCLPVSAAIALSIGSGGVGLLLEWD